jgi:hypothetical protein
MAIPVEISASDLSCPLLEFSISAIIYQTGKLLSGSDMHACSFEFAFETIADRLLDVSLRAPVEAGELPIAKPALAAARNQNLWGVQ